MFTEDVLRNAVEQGAADIFLIQACRFLEGGRKDYLSE